MNRRIWGVVIVILALLGWLLSGAVHELGHAAVAMLAGLEVRDLQPWALLGRLHVSYSGSTTEGWRAAIDVSGMLATVLVGIVGVAILASVSGRLPRARIGVWFFVPMLCQSLAWVFVPVGIAFGARFPGDDASDFIRNSGWPPLAVSLIGLGLIIASGAVLVLAFRKRQPAGEARPQPD